MLSAHPKGLSHLFRPIHIVDSKNIQKKNIYNKYKENRLKG